MTYTLKEYVKLFILQNLKEGKIREAEISGDRKVPWGCETHVKDLEKRVSDVTYWRDKFPRGSAKRYHWGAVLKQLKEELKSARRTNQSLNEKDEV